MNPKVERSLPVVLSLLGSIGVIGTAVLVAKETPKAMEELQKAKESKDKKKMVMSVVKNYGPSIAVGTATISSIIAGTIISKKTEASLTATTIMLDRVYRKYKNKVVDTLGLDVHKKITSEIAEDDYKDVKNTKKDDGKITYWQENVGFFRTSPAQLEKAVNLTNERIQSTSDEVEFTGMSTFMYASLRSFLHDAKAELLNEHEIDDVTYDYGWSCDYMNEVYDNRFVHIKTEPIYDENGEIKYVKVTFDKDPIFGIINSVKNHCYGYSIKDIEKAEQFEEYDDGFDESHYVK